MSLLSGNGLRLELRTQTQSLGEAWRPAVLEIGRLLRSGVDPVVAAEMVRARHAGVDRFFERSEASAFSPRPEYLFPRENPVTELRVEGRRRGAPRVIPIANRLATDQLGNVIRQLALCVSIDEAEAALDGEALRLFRSLCPAEANAANRPGVFAPGIHRLQHAALLVRTATTGILVDPHLHSRFEPLWLEKTFGLEQLAPSVDAIVITHSHEDHFSLSTLMMFPRDIPIVVPHVPRGSMLCGHMAEELRQAGFRRVFDPQWYAPPLSIGDCEISPLPFYGEQPLRHEAIWDSRLRNWGNTYLIATPAYKAWVLVDSGNELAAGMRDVAELVQARYGAIDLVAANLRRFTMEAGPVYILGDGRYWLALTDEQRCRFAEMAEHVVTLGPDGVAEICKLVGARACLPYAHWWTVVGAEPDEHDRSSLAELRAALGRLGARTTVLDWRVGDRLDPEHIRATDRGR